VRRVVWSIDANVDYREIISYIARDDALAAEKIAVRIRNVVQGLAAMPTGRPGRVSGTYEKVVSSLPYIIAYALGDEPRGHETITVLRVIHGARNWTDENWPE
jgi:plasmid stabilization system protein ParE